MGELRNIGVKPTLDTEVSKIVCGDCLDWLKWLPDESIDLCYIDPPFFSNRNYEVIWGNGFEVRAFGDRFAGGVQHYVEWMRDRVKLIHQKLKPTGAIFLHCDWHASHRLRVMLEDVFGEENFRNEIIWRRTPFSGSSKSLAKQYPVIHDTILYYGRSKNHESRFNCPTAPYSEEYLSRFKHKDVRGYYRKTLLKTFSKDTFERLKREDRLIEPIKSGAHYSYKQYLHESRGTVQIGSVWFDINMLNPAAKERLGYPTQKPLDLVKRVLECASHEGNVILDCFGGGGTTAVAATELNRKFITGDVSPVAVKIMSDRLTRNLIQIPFEVKNLARTEEEYREMDGHAFASIICEVMGWRVNSRKSGDKGIDGWDGHGHPVQVKNHKSAAGRPDLQRFASAVRSEKQKRGVFVSWSFSKDAREYVAEVKRDDGIELELFECTEAFSSLMLPPDKAAEIRGFYEERKPKEWSGDSAKEAIPQKKKRATLVEAVEDEPAKPRTTKKQA